MKIGEYDIISKLGSGAMGDVWLARDGDGREVALKTLSTILAGQDPAYVARFLREAQSVADIDHSNVINVYEAGVADGVHFIAMAYASGGTVAELLKAEGGILPVELALKIIRAAAVGLAAAAETGIVHRDLKPSNVLLDGDGRVMLGDFGLVRGEADQGNTLTQTGATLGTPAYMSPEQVVNPKSVDVRSDIYSLGVMLYQLVTGTLPFDGGNGLDVMMKQVEDPLPDPQMRNPDLDENTTAILMRMLAKDRVDRFQTPEALIAALDGKSLAPPKNRYLHGLGIAVVCLFIIGLGVIAWGVNQDRSSPDVPTLRVAAPIIAAKAPPVDIPVRPGSEVPNIEPEISVDTTNLPVVKSEIEGTPRINLKKGPADAVEYEGHTYKIYDAEITRDEAARSCEAMGGYLVTITTAEENKFVASQLWQHPKYKGFRYFIGATRPSGSGLWQWENGEALDWSRWATAAKEKWNVTDGVSAIVNRDGQWWPRRKDEVGGYICEWE